MDSVRNTVSYCSVSKSGEVVYSYNSGDNEIENLAALCLENAPLYHRWYFETMGKRTFGFLMDYGYVYFAIVNDSLGNSRVLKFLEKLRDEFREVDRKGSSRNVSSLDSLCLQEQLLPVVNHLVASLENVSETGSRWPTDNEPPYQGELTPSPSDNVNGQNEGGVSTKAPLLGKPTKQEKKKMKDHVIAIRDTEMEEHRRSSDRITRIDSGVLDSNHHRTTGSPLRKENSLRRSKSINSQNPRKKWCRQVKIIIVIDVVICVILFAIWLAICRGVQCIR